MCLGRPLAHLVPSRAAALQSGFEHPFKCHFLGDTYFEAGPDGNNILFTNVPNVRVRFRHESLLSELRVVNCEDDS